MPICNSNQNFRYNLNKDIHTVIVFVHFWGNFRRFSSWLWAKAILSAEIFGVETNSESFQMIFDLRWPHVFFLWTQKHISIEKKTGQKISFNVSFLRFERKFPCVCIKLFLNPFLFLQYKHLWNTSWGVQSKKNSYN